MDRTQAPVTENDEEQVEHCFGHPDTPTRLHCTRCDKAICGRCAVPASVGQHCVWCVAEARKSAPKVRSALRANAPVVYALIALNVVAYLLENLLGWRAVLNNYGTFPLAIADGETYRLLTAMFLHAPLSGGGFGILHILFNMYILSMYGPPVEQAFGHVNFAAMYLLAGLAGSAMSYALGPCNTLGVGASGAVFGVVGILLVYLYQRRNRAMMQSYMRGLGGFVMLNLAFGFIVPGIDNLAHIGGLVGGAALGLGLDAGDARQVGPVRRLVTYAAVAALVVFAVVWRSGAIQAGACGAFG